MSRFITGAVLAVVLAYAAHGQAASEFEAVSIKPAQRTGPITAGPAAAAVSAVSRLNGGPGTADPELLTSARITLQRLLCAAYGVQSDQVSGPDWLAEEKYQITAKVPPGATREQMELMLQQALTERFRLTFHLEKKSLAVWELAVAKTGSKLRKAGDPDAPAKMTGGMKDGMISQTYRAYPLSKAGTPGSNLYFDRTITAYLAPLTGEPDAAGRFADKTGLTGKYDFDLEFAPPPHRQPGASPSLDNVEISDAGPSLFVALEKQLGLKLERKKALLDVMVIDHAEKVPAEKDEAVTIR
jgi:uncharacterized protein (TIGR03435 family)